jgi:uncharacterized damage-inducible protein DinB
MSAFADYFDGIRKRTLKYIRRIPPDQMGFSPYPGKFTLGDLVRHLASTEAMFVRAVVAGGVWLYPGHEADKGETLEGALDYLNRKHEEAMAGLRGAGDELLTTKRPSLKGYPVQSWHLLMAMCEHETHHRAQISQYLVALGLETPQVFDLRIEQVTKE